MPATLRTLLKRMTELVMSRRLLKLSGGSSRPKRRSPSRQVLRLVL